MKKCACFLFALVVVFLCTDTLYAQWEQTSGPTGGLMIGYTAAGSFVYTAVPEVGLFRSSDRGRTWSVSKTGLLGEKIIALHADGKHVYVVTKDLLIHSSDYGDTWSQVDTLAVGTKASVVYASGSEAFVGTEKGVFYSTDEGTTWKTLGVGPFPRTDIARFYKKGDALFVATKDGSRGIYRTTDYGSNWSTWFSSTLSFPVQTFTALGATIYANAQMTLIQSTDDGLTWTVVIASPNVNAVAASHEQLFVASSGGVVTSTDGGKTWVKRDTFWDEKQIKSVIATGEMLYARSGDGIVFASSDAGTTWTTSSVGFVNTQVIALAATGSSTIYAGTYDHGLWRTSNSGNSWVRIDTGFERSPIWGVWFHDTELFVGTEHRIMSSSDGGDTWKRDDVESGLANIFKSFAAIGDTLFAASDAGVWRKANGDGKWNLHVVDPTDAFIGRNALTTIGSTLIGGSFYGLHRSQDRGQTWTLAYDGPVYAFAHIGTALFAGTSHGVLRSDDSGVSWTSVNAGLPANGVMTLVSAGPNLFAGTDGEGLFLSTNGGALWTDYNDAMPTTLLGRNVQALAVSGEHLFAGLYYTGVWRRSISDIAGAVGVDEEAFAPPTTSIQCRPNPLTFTTSITYDLIQPSYVIVTIINIHGECMATLLSEHRDAGEIELQWTPVDVPSGLYSVRVQCNGYTQAHPVLVIR